MKYIVKSLMHVPKVGILTLAIFSFAGCPRVWHFAIIDAKDPTHPVFCFSRLENCKGKGVDFSFMPIDEVNEKGSVLKKMWEIRPIKDQALNRVTYGEIPEGYRETMKALPLETGKWYSVQYTYFFRISKRDSQNKCEVYNHEKFIDKMNPK
jgi:hypothetical protein